MNKQINDDNIPVLTEVLHAGDASMQNHFDASYFDNTPPPEQDNTQTSVTNGTQQIANDNNTNKTIDLDNDTSVIATDSEIEPLSTNEYNENSIESLTTDSDEELEMESLTVNDETDNHFDALINSTDTLADIEPPIVSNEEAEEYIESLTTDDASNPDTESLSSNREIENLVDALDTDSDTHSGNELSTDNKDDDHSFSANNDDDISNTESLFSDLNHVLKSDTADDQTSDIDAPIIHQEKSLNNEDLNKKIDLIIYDAVQSIMPEIEQKLTEEISRKIQQALLNKTPKE